MKEGAEIMQRKAVNIFVCVCLERNLNKWENLYIGKELKHFIEVRIMHQKYFTRSN